MSTALLTAPAAELDFEDMAAIRSIPPEFTTPSEEQHVIVPSEEQPELIAPSSATTMYGAIAPTQDMTEAIEEGGLDFLVESVAVRPADNLQWDIPGFVAIRRQDDPSIVFNIPTSSYQLVQNTEVFAFAHPLIQAANGQYTRVGMFKRGASIFAFADLPETFQVTPDEVLKQHVVLGSSHDGSSSISLQFILSSPRTGMILPLQLREHKSTTSYRHTRNAVLRTQQVSHLLEIKRRFFELLLTQSQQLAGSRMSPQEAENFINRYLEIPTDPVPSRRLEMQQATRDAIMRQFRDPSLGVSIQGTRYAMLNAIAYYRNFQAGTRAVGKITQAEAKFASVLVGTGFSEINASFAMLLDDYRRSLVPPAAS